MEDKPDIVILHIGSNDLTHRNVKVTNISKIANEVISISKKCSNANSPAS